MQLNVWWMAPEYDRANPMIFPDRREEPQARVGTDVRYDNAQARWVSAPIRVYVGPSHC